MNIFKKWFFKKELKEFNEVLESLKIKVRDLRYELDQKETELEVIQITMKDYIKANKEKKAKIDELEKKLKIKKTKASKK